MAKYNEGKDIPKEEYQQSSIWKYLHENIDEILDSDIDDKKQKSSYIPNPSIESILSTLLKYSTEHRYFMLSGLTGIGKTTIMRHVFFSDKSVTTPIIKNRNLIIPIDFNSFIEPSVDNNYCSVFEEMYIRIFSQATIIVQNNFNIPDITDRDFVKFFEDNHSGVINYIDKFGKRNTYAQMREEVYNDDNNRIYAVIAELCIALNHPNSNIKNFIMIVDNIESLGIYKTPIEVPLLIAHKALNFMCKKSVIKSRRPKWVPNILICCRHYIYRIMHSRDFEDGSLSQIFESFSKPVYIDLDLPAPLHKIVEKRYEAHMKSKKIKDKKRSKSMNVVRDMLLKIIEETNLNGNNIILDFNLSDIRNTLKTLKDIIYNKPWIQRNDFEDHGSFIISDVSDFNCKRSNILRAIGMKSGYVYSSEDNLIPNLLENNSDNIANVYDLMSLKYFINRASSWRASIIVNDFYKDVNEIFGSVYNDIKPYFNTAIWHLLKNRMLLRSSDQEQRDISSITFQNYREIDCVYVSIAAKDYWKLLNENSTILEMLMDDIYIDEEKYSFANERQQKFRVFNKDSFLMALSYLFELFENEKFLIEIIIDNNKVSEFIKCFGKTMVTEHLLNGLSCSFDSYFRGQRTDEGNYINDCQAKMNSLRKKIENIHAKLNI